MTTENSQSPVTLAGLARMKKAGEKIVCLTAYDASFAALAEAAGVEVVLVGDSLGMVLQGHESTLPVSMADMIYHGACVARAGGRALRIVDMPFMSYGTTVQALDNAARLMAEGMAHMVKLEGGAGIVETVRALSGHGIPVCGHLGLLPQSIHKLGGYRVQGRDAASAQAIVSDALALQDAGAGLLVLECVPAELGAQVARQLSIPVIGIGAGISCDGQILVMYDVLGVTTGKRPRFSKDFLIGHDSVAAALGSYVQAVKSGAFPGPEHSY